MAEKRTRQLPPVRIDEQLEVALMRLAMRDERSVTEYVRLVLERHAFGHARMVGQDLFDDQNNCA